MKLYLDHAAATPMHSSVLAAMQPYFSEYFFNPSAIYLGARDVRHALSGARESVARAIGCRPTEVIFTAGGTEANNLFIHGVMRQFPGSHAVTTQIEHDSVLQPVRQYDHTLLPVDHVGLVNVTELTRAITEKTVLVSVQYVNNEIGTIQSLKELSEVISEIRKQRKANGNALPLYLHTDACQAPLYLDVHASSLGVDALTLNGGKMYGPKQSGILYVDAAVRLSSPIQGGGQEHGLRSGTENVAAIIGLAAALKRAQDRRPTEAKRMLALQQYAIARLSEAFPDSILNGSRKHRIANNIHFSFAGVDNERLIMELDERGILCAAGSACKASSDEPSHVLRAIGLDEQAMQSSIRFTMGDSTTQEDIDYLVTQLQDIFA